MLVRGITVLFRCGRRRESVVPFHFPSWNEKLFSIRRIERAMKRNEVWKILRFWIEFRIEMKMDLKLCIMRYKS